MLSWRSQALLVLELLAGLRVGEATAGGDLHGLEANNMCFITPADYLTSSDDLGQTVEVMVRDSKTGPGRHASFVAMTQGPCAIKGGPIMRQWLKVAGIRTFKEIRGGFKVETPSYYVARLNLVGLSRRVVDEILSSVETTKYSRVAIQAMAIKKYVKERYNAVTLPEEMRYVNITGGVKFMNDVLDPTLKEALAWASAMGVSDHMLIVPGPLIRVTLGKRLTHMPLATKSTYTHLIAAMKEAYALSLKMDTPDMEFDLQGLKEAKFGNHSLRRHADKKARESLLKHVAAGISSVTKEVIDYFFGWLLKERRKDMQLHYAGMDLFARRVLARVTMFF